ncbi:hypothetical protein TWF594_007635 [Orbilia oligospora]|uniref:Uncharacterized protein n=1 Tax=Orbilia oligospora TaxID=2813651 RepID=A0A7C8JPE8_ORBOL|nr:hypothetical protein TWF594_007635 [Orbilia oligospora]KAF3137247.1 hypothetical protein TWF703_005170 [Orbilia oligospora]
MQINNNIFTSPPKLELPTFLKEFEFRPFIDFTLTKLSALRKVELRPFIDVPISALQKVKLPDFMNSALTKCSAIWEHQFRVFMKTALVTLSSLREVTLPVIGGLLARILFPIPAGISSSEEFPGLSTSHGIPTFPFT